MTCPTPKAHYGEGMCRLRESPSRFKYQYKRPNLVIKFDLEKYLEFIVKIDHTQSALFVFQKHRGLIISLQCEIGL